VETLDIEMRTDSSIWWILITSLVTFFLTTVLVAKDSSLMTPACSGVTLEKAASLLTCSVAPERVTSAGTTHCELLVTSVNSTTDTDRLSEA